MSNTSREDDLHERTRQIYEKQHQRIAGDRSVFERIIGSYSAEKFKIDPDWFQGKTALDAGCGNFGALIKRLADLGCKKIYACDIGVDWIPKLTKNLLTKGVDPKKFELKTGNVCRLPYEDQTFDFVAINGVLVHLKDMDEIESGFIEGARVCKKGGYYFTSWGPSGGLVQGRIMPAARQHYREDPWFKSMIDNISPKMIHEVIDKLCIDSEKNGGEKINGDFLKSLFGEDFCVFLQNFIQAPQWWTNECTPDYVSNLYKKHGFIEIQRLNEFVKRSDVRKFFAPLHYDWNHPISRALYGNGYVKYIAIKG